jgi:hypothetical protein
MISCFWPHWRDDIIIFVALALAMTVAMSVGTALAEPTAVEHQKLVKAQMSTVDYDSVPESVSLGTEP